MVGAQHESRRDAAFVDEDCVDSTVGQTQMTSGHATVCMAKVEKKGTKVDVV